MNKEFKQQAAVLKAKCNLYKQLSKLDPTKMSYEDFKLMNQLGNNPQVQSLLKVKNILDKF